MSENLTVPSSKRTSTAKKEQQLIERGEKISQKMGVDIGVASLFDGSQPAPTAGTSTSMAGTPLAQAMDDLAGAKRTVQAAGGDEAAIIRAVAQRIRQKVSELPSGVMTPMSDKQIDALVDQAIKQILDKQRIRLTEQATAALRMSSTRKAVPLLAADAERLRHPRNLDGMKDCRTAMDWLEFNARTIQVAKRRMM